MHVWFLSLGPIQYMKPTSSIALYQKLKNHIYERVERGEWAPGHQVPSEHDFVRELGVSRMTANRALRELAAEGYLTRVQGSGTFVADSPAQSEIIKIRNIAKEIRERGHRHHSDVRELKQVAANPAVARAFGLAPGARVFHSLVVHHENDVPIQIEDRYVNPTTASNYLSVDFTKTTTNEYLVRVAPISEVQHIIEAVMPDRRARQLLRISASEPCLRLFRLVWSDGVPSSCAWLTYPGSLYRMVARFTLPRARPLQSADVVKLKARRSRRAHPKATRHVAGSG